MPNVIDLVMLYLQSSHKWAKYLGASITSSLIFYNCEELPKNKVLLNHLSSCCNHQSEGLGELAVETLFNFVKNNPETSQDILLEMIHALVEYSQGAHQDRYLYFCLEALEICLNNYQEAQDLITDLCLVEKITPFLKRSSPDLQKIAICILNLLGNVSKFSIDRMAQEGVLEWMKDRLEHLDEASQASIVDICMNFSVHSKDFAMLCLDSGLVKSLLKHSNPYPILQGGVDFMLEICNCLSEQLFHKLNHQGIFKDLLRLAFDLENQYLPHNVMSIVLNFLDFEHMVDSNSLRPLKQLFDYTYPDIGYSFRDTLSDLAHSNESSTRDLAEDLLFRLSDDFGHYNCDYE